MAFNVRTFYTRATTAVVFVALLLGCVWYNEYSFVAFFAVVGFIGLYEFYKIGEKLSAHPIKGIGYFIFVVSSIGTFIYAGFPFYVYWKVYTGHEFLCVIILSFPLLFIAELFRKNGSFINIGYMLASFLYVILPIILLPAIANVQNPVFYPYKVLGMIFFIWINDTGAYLVGSFIGKHKLYEKISPNKTWEGTLGGIALCITLSFVVAHIFPQLALKHWIVISVIVAVFGTLGDLVESMLKRMAGVKDSGKLMPGHGGVLDRFDSLFFATPFVFCYLALMGLL
jgi:phosphatidate cytidylyltransferase